MPAAGRQPGTATEDHEVAGQRPALPEHHALLRQAMSGGRERAITAPAAGALRSGRRPVRPNGPRPVLRGNP
ncbi:hypothetical protein EGJ89_09625 [Stenotrophomonas maltophilia]|nr:hypothetical protein EGJ89_09625 [Stenotrophomonas maltophilia]